jgi:AraC-like DNA-binding protein
MAKKVKFLTLDNMSEFLPSNIREGKNRIFLEHNFGMMMQPHGLEGLSFPLGEPLQVAEVRIGYIVEGSADYTINMVNVHVDKGDIIILCKESIVEWASASDDFFFNGFAFSDELGVQAFGGLPPSMFNHYMGFYHLRPDEQGRATFLQFLNSMWAVTQLPDCPPLLLESLVKSTLIFIEYLYDREQKRVSPQVSREQSLFNEFLQQVNQHVAKEHNIPFYADRLCLSPRYFSTLVKKVSGSTAKEWIDRALVIRAKVMLRHTDKQISQIADALGFPNTSFFCKFFREHTGMNPGSYRTT